MNSFLVYCLIVSILLTPVQSFAQRGGHRGGSGAGGGGGRSGGGWNGNGHNGGGFQGHAGGNAPQGSGPRTAANSTHSRPTFNQQVPTRSIAAYHRPSYHGNWYHGDWHGHWAHPWAYRPWGWYGGGVGWGFGWGLGVGVATVGLVSLTSPWGWGYYSYYNPYWVAPVGGVTYINYAQPIVVAQPIYVAQQAGVTALPPAPSDAAGQPNAAQARALASFDSARSFFKRGDFAMALSQTNRAIALAPNDSLMHEFRALCLFATQDYQQAAAGIHAVLSSGPGWDKATLLGLYATPEVYNEQLGALESYRNAHPEAAAARFLLAYHCMLIGDNEQAIAELQAVVDLEPKDQLAAQLLTGLTTTPQEEPVPSAAEEPTEEVDLANVIGSWQSSRPDGAKFELTLTEDNKFSWKVNQQDKQQKLTGTYTLADNYLILTARNQNALVGHVALEPGDKLKFKLAGGSPNDPGLTFSR